ncbi:MAG: hypothetical protein CMH62_01690 [Nanoarchaeota archaeon]|nr:hypothetical protein [Nanoarchaeota archaeon]
MKFIGKSPVRISMCNSGDTDYHIKDMGWSNLINATLASSGYVSIVEEKKQNHIDYFYINRFSGTVNHLKIYDLEEDNNYLKLITETIKEMRPSFKGVIKIVTNVPERSGLGGSSSLVVSLIKAFSKANSNRNIFPEEIARLAYKIERETVGIKGGYQDQWAASYGGGVNYLEFKKDNIFLEPLWLSEKLMSKLESNLVLFFIEARKMHSGDIHEILEKKVKKEKKESLDIMLERRNNVIKTREALLSGDVKRFARLLNHEQRSKEKLYSDLLTSKAKRIYEGALSYGAIAGKISGAGSGGCAFFIYPEKNKKKFLKNMVNVGCRHIPLKLQRLNTMGEI